MTFLSTEGLFFFPLKERRKEEKKREEERDKRQLEGKRREGKKEKITCQATKLGTYLLKCFIIIICILKMRKLSFQEVKELAEPEFDFKDHRFLSDEGFHKKNIKPRR